MQTNKESCSTQNNAKGSCATDAKKTEGSCSTEAKKLDEKASSCSTAQEKTGCC